MRQRLQWARYGRARGPLLGILAPRLATTGRVSYTTAYWAKSEYAATVQRLERHLKVRGGYNRPGRAEPYGRCRGQVVRRWRR